MSLHEKTKTYPLTEQEFNDGTGYTFRDIPLCEDEGGQYVYAYGHRDRVTYAKAVNDFEAEMGVDDPDSLWTAESVEHHWSVATSPADGPDGWWIKWRTFEDGEPITAETPNAFPLTVVTR